MKIVSAIILLLLVLTADAFEFPVISDQWLRAAPPNAKMLAAYVTIDNHSEKPMKLIGAYAPEFGMTEIHKTIEVDGMLKMREQKELNLAINGQIKMRPGDLHIMLMMPQKRFIIGDMTRICLIYADDSGEEFVQHLDFPVKRQ